MAKDTANRTPDELAMDIADAKQDIEWYLGPRSAFGYMMEAMKYAAETGDTEVAGNALHEILQERGYIREPREADHQIEE